MALWVQKYGGSAFESLANIRQVSILIEKSLRLSNSLIIVVSASRGKTDTLIQKALSVCARPDKRELDALISLGEQESACLLTMALQGLGIKAISLSREKAGIYTDNNHTDANIINISKNNIQQYLHQGKVVIIAGFQGVNERGDVCTLGRGGSDLTAVALAHFFKAESCQLYKDVRGLYTQDPYVFEDAKYIPYISYEECLGFLENGAKIIQAKALHYAKVNSVPIELRCLSTGKLGTLISHNNSSCALQA